MESLWPLSLVPSVSFPSPDPDQYLVEKERQLGLWTFPQLPSSCRNLRNYFLSESISWWISDSGWILGKEGTPQSHCFRSLFVLWISFASSPYLAFAWIIPETENLPDSSLMGKGLDYDCKTSKLLKCLTYLSDEWFWRSLLCRVTIIIYHPNQDTFKNKRGANDNYAEVVGIKSYCLGQTSMYGHLTSVILWLPMNDTNQITRAGPGPWLWVRPFPQALDSRFSLDGLPFSNQFSCENFSAKSFHRESIDICA